jgi:hypothetical protein
VFCGKWSTATSTRSSSTSASPRRTGWRPSRPATEAFDAHWRRLLADDSLTKKAIVYEGEVAGNIGASIRVLEKCGFVRVGSHKNDVEELLYELRDGV